MFNKKSSKKPLILLGIFLLILIVAQIWVNNALVSDGEKLENIIKLKKTYEMENILMENEIANNLSLATIATRSSELGFLTPEKIQYIR